MDDLYTQDGVIDMRVRLVKVVRTLATERGIRLNPNGVSALANLGVLLARTNRADEAMKMFAAVLRIAPDHPEATLNLGLQYSIRGDDVRALALLQRAIALGLDTYDARYRSGVSLYNLKRMDEASLAFESALTRSAKPAD